ncbi:MAG: hypothetical protein AAF671_00525 [Pseudomonadota bacterium]
MENSVQHYVPVRIVKSGEWLFDGDLDLPVDIVVLTYDWYYENDKKAGVLRDGAEPTPLGPEGTLFHVRFQEAGEIDDLWIDGGCYPTLQEAVEGAQWKAPSKIKWLNYIFIQPGH